MSLNGFPGWGGWPVFPSIVPPLPPPLPTVVPPPIQTPVLPSIPTSPGSLATPTDFTVTFPFPPPSSTTVTSLVSVTIQPTSLITTTTTTLSSNFVSTVTETSVSLSITPLPNPAATSAIANQSSLLQNNATLSRTNITVSLVLGILIFLLLIGLLILFTLYIRRRRKHPNSDDESPPFTSLAPRPAPNFVASRQSASVPNLPPAHMRETSLSMGPTRGGTADSYSRALAVTQANTQAQLALASPSSGSTGTPRRVFFRSASAPVEAPEPPPRIPPFVGLSLPSIGLFGRSPTASPSPKGTARGRGVGATSTPPPRPATATGGSGPGPRPSGEAPRPPLQRQSSMPLHHAALRDQAEAEREASLQEEAGRLGVPVIALQRDGERGSTASLRSEDIFGEGEKAGEGSGKRVEGEEDGESDSGGEREREREEKASRLVAAAGAGAGADNGRQGVLHSTRASSGVFPEPEREREDVPERSEKDIYS